MAATRMISIIGLRKAGKTTFLAALAADMVLVEGFEDAPLPKIEVYRSVAGPKPLFDPAVHDPGDWIAFVTDDRSFRAPFPVFRFSDTAWLVTIANLAWDRAKILPP